MHDIKVNDTVQVIDNNFFKGAVSGIVKDINQESNFALIEINSHMVRNWFNLDDCKKVSIENFEKFWQIYPRKIARSKCLRIWIQKGLDEFAEEIVDHLNKCKQSSQWQETVYIPHPATYLNQERWWDEVI